MLELLLVISIIGLLVGILLPVLSAVKKRGQIRATQPLIAGISSALNQYYADFDEYPPSTPDYPASGRIPSVTKLSGPATEPDSLYKYLNGPDGEGFTITNSAGSRHYGPYMKGLPKENLSISGTQTIVTDSWHHPLVFLNCKAHLLANGDPSLCHNRDFDIYSVGPDGMRDPLNDDKDNNGDGRVDEAAELVDDLTNW